ncbi:unnamed protein product [Blepharisma stoltei]|uniref:Kinesin-like protein n=1 Tax=Blepharisma stoltei TaxID=1481888 RepID=A0AAU9IW95_9CILI|nr:unnamed protein product [Blepharisma stoltei]
MEENSENLKVAIRVRPILPIDKFQDSVVYLEENNNIRVSDGDHFIAASYDRIFPSDSSQNEVFGYVKSSVEGTVKGFNCTIFAYGQTGSGKTYTMFGSDWEQNNPAPQVYYKQPQNRSIRKYKSASPSHMFNDPSKYGIILNSIHHLMEYAEGKSFTFYCSFLQIYNEKIYDLLQNATRDKPLNIREDKVNGIFVENLAEYVVQNAADCFYLLEQGDKNRIVRQTRYNHHSSRSHTIFQILLESDKANKRGVLKKAKLNLCDLAGSEKYDKDSNMVKEHIQEMTLINKSLSILGKVISALGSQNSAHIPFRESKLTRILQDSLAVNTRTILIATVSPSLEYIEETINTLKFADRAKQVMVKIKKNEISATNDQLVSKLQREIQHLKDMLNLRKKGGFQEINQQIWSLKEENERLKKITRDITVEEVEKLKQENKNLRLELQTFKQMDSTENSFFVTASQSKSSSSSNQVRDFPPPPQIKDILPALESGAGIQSTLEEWRKKDLENAVENLKFKIGKEGRCPICTLKPPCKHYLSSDEIPKPQTPPKEVLPLPTYPRQTRSSTVRSENTETPRSNLSFNGLPKHMTIRYRNSSAKVEETAGYSEYVETEKRKKFMKAAENNMIKLAKIEAYREEKIKRELEKLEEERKKEEEDEIKQQLQELKRRKYLEQQKKKLEELRVLKEKEQIEISMKRKSEEEEKLKKLKKEKKYFDSQKKKIVEHNRKKALIDGIMMDQIDELTNNVLNSKSSGRSERTIIGKLS